ncbi:hypothetical protein CLV42_10848 [Chitinophaga ginsengisoli]|uniref:Uncharacterized protein n=1 Tax=Chitinophaga ginsengisoli TaxID=363837 RepID=A0A2P8G2D3_9BACT|nr:hypothetical protein CLV42_10848 [Chitinophaga ginsengisoli]
MNDCSFYFCFIVRWFNHTADYLNLINCRQLPNSKKWKERNF